MNRIRWDVGIVITYKIVFILTRRWRKGDKILQLDDPGEGHPKTSFFTLFLLSLNRICPESWVCC